MNFIPATDSFTEWQKDPDYIAEYNALEEEFVEASALIQSTIERSSEKQIAGS